MKEPRASRFARNTIIEVFLLMGFWLLLSGHYDRMHISFGIFSVSVVTIIHYPLRKKLLAIEDNQESEKICLARLAFYIPWLIWQIVIASLQVAAVVLHPRCPIDPSLVRFRTSLKSTTYRVILGNSITLTPGTITVGIEGDEFLVHSLMDASSSGLVDGSLPGQVAGLFEKKQGKVVKEVELIRD